MLADTLIPEAYERRQGPGLVTTLGFGLAFALSLLDTGRRASGRPRPETGRLTQLVEHFAGESVPQVHVVVESGSLDRVP